MITNIVPNQSLGVVINPYYAKEPIPGIPVGARERPGQAVDRTSPSNALSVLNNTADMFDWADTIPGSLLPQIKAKALDRFDAGQPRWFDLLLLHELTQKPFNSQLAREAVVTGLNQDAMNRLGSGTLMPACFFLPAGVPGHSARQPVPVRRPRAPATWPRPSRWSSSPGWPARRSPSGARAARRASSG